MPFHALDSTESFHRMQGVIRSSRQDIPLFTFGFVAGDETYCYAMFIADNIYYVNIYMKGDALQRNTSTVNVNRQYRVLALPE